MAVFDWLRRGGRQPDPPVAWTVYREGDAIVVEDGRGGVFRAVLGDARTVRIVPLTGGNHHAAAGGGDWQVALSHSAGDQVLGKPMADWRAARELAQLVCSRTELPLDELSQKLFSRVGDYSPPTKEG